MADKQVSVRISAQGGAQLKGELTEIGRVGQTSFKVLETSATRAGGGMQNASYQIADVFTQISAGADPMRAVAIQLPQLLGGFGMMGAAAGAAASILPVLFGAFVSGAQDVKTLEDALSSAEGRLREIQKLNDSLTLSGIAKLKEEYGEVNAELLVMLRRQRELATLQAFREMRSGLASVRDEMDGWGNDAKDIADFLDVEPSVVIDGFRTLNPLVQQFLDLEKQAASAESFKDQADAAAQMAQMIIDAAGGLGKLSDEQAKVVETLWESESVARKLAAAAPTADWMDAAIDGVGGLIGRLWEAVGAANSLSTAREAATAQANVNLSAMKVEFSPGGQAMLAYGSRSPEGTAAQMALETRNTPRSSGGRSGGGSGGGADRDRMEAMREAERLFEQTRSSAEKYAVEVERINELHALFPNIVTDEVVGRGMDLLKDKFLEVGDAAKGFKDVTDSMKDAILEFAVDGANSFDQVAKSIQKMAMQALLFGDGPLGEFFGGGLLGMFGKGLGIGGGTAPSFDGGGWTGTGARAGGLDGKGGYMAMVHPDELVVDLKRANRGAGRSNGGAGTMVQVNNYSSEPATEERSKGPNGEDLIRVTVGRQLQRGDHDKAMRRFGAKPAAVKR